MAARPQSPPPASGKGVAAVPAVSAVTRTLASVSTPATAGSAATSRISSGDPVNAIALTSQKRFTGPSMSSTTSPWVEAAVVRSARSRAAG